MNSNPQSRTPKSKAEGYYNSKGGFNLEWDTERAHADVMVRYPKTYSAECKQLLNRYIIAFICMLFYSESVKILNHLKY